MERKRFEELFKCGPSQKIFELWSLLCFLERFLPNPEAIIEIGVFSGGTFRFWNSILSRDGILIGIDTNMGGGDILSVQKEFENDSRVRLIIGNSTSPETIGKAKEILGNLKADMLFIDGNHKYDWVKSDFNQYKEFVKPKGLVVFHDMENRPTVKKLWDEIIAERNFEGYCEFHAGEDPCGTGVIIKKSD